jgi:hypothetical protein
MRSKPRSRKDLEDLWRKRAESARLLYESARTECERARMELAGGFTVPPDGSFAYRRALLSEAAALRERVRTLRIFTDLTVLGKTPEDDEAPTQTPAP